MKHMSIAKKSIRGLVILGLVLLLGTSLAAGVQMYRQNMEIYRQMAFSYVNLATATIDGDIVRDVIRDEARFKKLCDFIEDAFSDGEPVPIEDIYAQPDFDEELVDLYQKWNRIYVMLLSVGNRTSGIKYFYVVVPEENELIYVWDSDLENSLGVLEHARYSEGEKENLMRVFNGDDEDSMVIYHEDGQTYGTAMQPIYDNEGDIVAVAVADTSITDIRRAFFRLLLNIGAAVTLIMLVAVTVYFSFVRRQLIEPIVKLEKATVNLIDDLKNETPFHVDVHTGDEIETLAHSFEEMDNRLKIYLRENTAITAEKERIQTELDLATRIQRDMLPGTFPPFPEFNEFDIYASMKTAREVGGDFYDFFLIDEDHLGLTIADVSDKGIPAALFMMMSRRMLRDYAMTGRSPRQVVELMNRQICDTNEEGMFVTVWFGILDLKDGTIRAVNAGHEYPILGLADGSYELFKDVHGFVVGGLPDITYKEYVIRLKPGESLFLYTDGLTEACNEKNVLFGTDQVIRVLNAKGKATAKELVEHVQDEAMRFAGSAPQADDMTLLCLEWKGAQVNHELPERSTELTVKADVENLDEVLDFLNERLDNLGCTPKARMQIEIALEELFVNVAHYAYAENGTDGNDKNMVSVRVDELNEPLSVAVTLSDSGLPFDPLSREDPDITLSADERRIGGLGIYMVKKSMDNVHYEYRNGKNILKFRKDL